MKKKGFICCACSGMCCVVDPERPHCLFANVNASFGEVELEE